MSLITKKLIKCDECAAEEMFDSTLTAPEVRRVLRNKGWQRVGTQDICDKHNAAFLARRALEEEVAVLYYKNSDVDFKGWGYMPVKDRNIINLVLDLLQPRLKDA